jgi:hypothetical protein
MMVQRYGAMAPYYWHLDQPRDSAYDFYRTGSSRSAIKVLVHPPNQWQEIAQAAMTGAIRALAGEVSKSYIAVHRDSYEDVARLVAWEGAVR